MCKKHEKEYINIRTGEKLDWERVDQLPDNAMLKVKPELWIEWDFEKNEQLAFDIWKMTKGSRNEPLWICEKYYEPYPQKICSKIKSNSCKICCGKYVIEKTSIAHNFPHLLKEWHPTKNGDLTPYDTPCGSDKIVWWKCEKHDNHEWCTQAKTRCIGNNCPYCANQKILIGYNDIWTTNPELARLFANTEDGYKYTQGVTEKVDFKCPDCGEIANKRSINYVRTNGFVCGVCGDKKSLPEKIMFNVLTQLNIDFEHNITIEWSNGKKYDFILKDFNTIIETHGGQHYFEGFSYVGGKTLKEEQFNDALKLKMAIQNKVNNYIVVDCRYSKFEYIKKSIINNKELNKILDLSNINWSNIQSKCINNSLLNDICDDWNKTSDIDYLLKKYKISKDRLYKLLKLGGKLSKCKFDDRVIYNFKTKKMNKAVLQFDRFGKLIKKFNSAVEAGIEMGHASGNIISQACRHMTDLKGYYWVYENDYLNNNIEFKKKRTRGSVLQLDDDLNVIKEWNSCNEAYRYLTGKEGSDGAIANCCNFKANTAYGYKWLYKNDYEDIKNGLKDYVIYSNYKFTREIVQLSLDEKLIRKWDSIKEATEYVKGNNACISAVLKEKNDTAYGYKWMYLEDYEKLIEGLRAYRKEKTKRTVAKTIIQLTNDMKFIKEWRSMVDASKELNLNKGTIWWACKNNKIYGDSRWVYKEDYDKYIEDQSKLA